MINMLCQSLRTIQLLVTSRRNSVVCNFFLRQGGFISAKVTRHKPQGRIQDLGNEGDQGKIGNKIVF